MKVLIVFAHPDERSLNGSLLEVAVKQLKDDGHEVKVSDLYKMKWKAVIDEDDFLNHNKGERLQVAAASGGAFFNNKLTEDVVAEQEKLEWADTVIFQFPLWWYSMPSILKGWVERVYSLGLAYGVGEHNETKWGDRYGDGKFKGKRGMLLITVGGSNTHYSARGISGPIEDLLFPINHGILFYPGFDVLPPFTVYSANTMEPKVFEEWSEKLREHLHNIETLEPIKYRRQNGGDYIFPSLELKPEIGDKNDHGFSLHIEK
ncbi:hypothetical protein Kpol_538p51 [Vanderwaltozyma polyspora DSM 70294]|uniref:Flavodoxin-like fold domain-containing protein n=1 Tax=Vanderwaltozyma polyspora (strain ATCC 22028 / DSM 70294 / BCRC 21397 / CBS 2163 / NBRC 10782 / NRRL Y-8283 / UCD 57-17) TaxID=436907 RepID=A7TKG4_VANPO|nr:uncharacterized protein Kpol_538p51 [Vanderwaltozyma polyspora DSM 70294]EDO17291.1 hypothetical protein Kpol_538p51 [Vanderwaltozyma polyspora DSM 70294]